MERRQHMTDCQRSCLEPSSDELCRKPELAGLCRRLPSARITIPGKNRLASQTAALPHDGPGTVAGRRM